MRVANKDVDFVTPEQIEKARSVDLLDYVKRTEPGNVERCGHDEYRLKDHDSLKISNGKFHWFSRGIGGTNAIDFLVKVRGMEFREAVRELAGDSFAISDQSSKRAPPIMTNPKPQSQDDVRVFMLPEANSHNNDVIDYLKGRGIEENIIADCISRGSIYQSKKNNCVFVGIDEKQNPKFACERGMGISEYKKDVTGSNKAFSFCMLPNNSDTNRLYVFEGVVDCLSHATIAQIGGTDWDGYRLSLGGIAAVALKTFLENNPHTTEVHLALDNDHAGKEATERIIKEVLENEAYDHINLYIAPPPIGKDYNDTLMFLREKIKEKELQSSHINALKEQPQAVTKRRTEASL